MQRRTLRVQCPCTLRVNSRQGFGLRAKNFDLLRKHATIYENAVKVGGAMVVGTLKGHKHRSVPLPDFLVLELARTCEGKDQEICCGPLLPGNTWVRHQVMTHGRVAQLHVIARRLQLKPEKLKVRSPRHCRSPVTAQDLRHTAPSLSISAGANVKVVQKMLGHKGAAMTLDVYADLFDDDLEAAADKLNSAVGKLWAETA